MTISIIIYLTRVTSSLKVELPKADVRMGEEWEVSTLAILFERCRHQCTPGSVTCSRAQGWLVAEPESTGWHMVGIQHVVAFIIIPTIACSHKAIHFATY